MILSKHPDMHLSSKWPTYYNRAKDFNVWDQYIKKLINSFDKYFDLNNKVLINKKI